MRMERDAVHWAARPSPKASPGHPTGPTLLGIAVKELHCTSCALVTEPTSRYSSALARASTTTPNSIGGSSSQRGEADFDGRDLVKVVAAFHQPMSGLA